MDNIKSLINLDWRLIVGYDKFEDNYYAYASPVLNASYEATGATVDEAIANLDKLVKDKVIEKLQQKKHKQLPIF